MATESVGALLNEEALANEEAEELTEEDYNEAPSAGADKRSLAIVMGLLVFVGGVIAFATWYSRHKKAEKAEKAKLGGPPDFLRESPDEDTEELPEEPSILAGASAPVA